MLPSVCKTSDVMKDAFTSLQGLKYIDPCVNFEREEFAQIDRSRDETLREGRPFRARYN